MSQSIALRPNRVAFVDDAPSQQHALPIISTAELAKRVGWGRKRKAAFLNSMGALAMVLLCPVWLYVNWITLEHYDASVTKAIASMRSYRRTKLICRDMPMPTLAATLGYAAWILFQGALYHLLPGPVCKGQRTPAGHLLTYRANGLLAWAVTHLTFLGLCKCDVVDLAIIARNWPGLLFVANAYGFALAAWAQWRGYRNPSYPQDRKLSGSWIFDFWAGVELNPRLGGTFDLKFFHNGRPGIVAWTLVDISWAAYQHQKLGYVTASMWIALALHTVYVVDFFWNEDWYLRTIDISHDHFGFMLTWGDSTFLPTFYTLQCQYLARYPTHLTPLQATGILALGLAGYYVFRAANHQRDYVRERGGNAQVWGRPAALIPCTYRTDDDKEHHTVLLASGWWGASRHANYMGDLMQALAMCATCGTGDAIPYSYFCFMFVLLNHRALRDEERCHKKYGRKWEEYCKAVPFRIIPGLY